MRRAVVAGSFYASAPGALEEQIKGCFLHPLGPGKLPEYKKGERIIKGGVIPHAGYPYSGPVAAWLYHALAEDGFPETFVVLGPNHTGRGSAVAITLENFETPLGEVPVDKPLAERMVKGIIDRDIEAHAYEHSIEVQLPFLQFVHPEFKLVPLCMALQDLDTAREVGKIISEAIDTNVCVLASSDLTHYELREQAERKDKLALEAILKLDPAGLYTVVREHNISMCGYGPVMAMLESIKGKSGELLKYATSGDIETMREVVGYASVVIK